MPNAAVSGMARAIPYLACYVCVWKHASAGLKMAASGVWSTCSRPSASVFAGRCSLRHSMLCETRPWTNSRERFSPPITAYMHATQRAQHALPFSIECTNTGVCGVQVPAARKNVLRSCDQHDRGLVARSTRAVPRSGVRSPWPPRALPLIGLRFSSAALHTPSALLSSEALWSTVAVRVTGANARPPGSVPSPHHPGGGCV